MVTAIFVVDVQNDFVEGGSLAVAGGKHVAQIVRNELTPMAMLFGMPVLYSKDWHVEPGDHFASTNGTEPDYINSWPDHCVAETAGAEFALDFNAPEDHVFLKGQYKASYSAVEGVNASGKGLVPFLKENKIDTVLMVGIAYDYCVKASAIDLVNAGFRVSVNIAGTASVHPENNDAVTAELKAAGVEVWDKSVML